MLARFQNALDGSDVPVLRKLDATPVRSASGRPLVVAGNNALVARLRRTDGRDIALRILASPGKAGDWAVRYPSLDQFQRQREISRFPDGFEIVRHPFQDDPAGIAVAMEWIQGPTLTQAVERAIRTGNASVLRALQAACVRCWNDLVDTGVTHADLVPSNLIVRNNGQVAVVDFDGASWPGSPFASSGEGSAAYRHPEYGRQADLRDPFGLLVIVTSLAVLAEEPDLWSGRVSAQGQQEPPLLFSGWDLAHAQTSRTFHEVLRRVSPASATLVRALVSASSGALPDLVAAFEAIPGARIPPGLAPAGTERPGAWDVSPVVERIRAHYLSTWDGDDAASASAPRPVRTSGQREGVTTDVWPSWRAAEQEPPVRVATADIEELKQALARNDEAEVIRIWGLLRNEPAAAMFAADVEGVLSASYDRRILEEARQRRDGATIALGDEAAIRKIPLGPRARSVVRQARERVEVQARLDHALATNDRDALAELAISGQLVVLGDTDRSSLERVIQAVEWPVLERAIEADDDVLIDAAFDDDLFGSDISIDPAIRARVDLARARIAWLASVRDALAKRRVRDLTDLFVDPPAGAAERLGAGERRRIRRMIEQEQAVAHLSEEIERGDEPRIISALNRVERVSARISDRATWAAIQRVVERVTLIDDLLDAAEEDPPDYGRLAQLLPAVRALGLEQDPRLGRSDFVARMEQQLVRMAHVRRIQAAIARDNDIAIVTAAVPDPHDALELLTTEERDRVARAIRARRQTARSLHAR